MQRRYVTFDVWPNLIVLWLMFAAPQATAQSAIGLFSAPAVRRALDYIKVSEPETIVEQITTCEIPAPPFKEAARADHYRQLFRKVGLKDVRIDREGNVIGERPGLEILPTLVLAAHLDTVFPDGTDVSVKHDGAVLKAPGIGDDCRLEESFDTTDSYLGTQRVLLISLSIVGVR
jgi:hypothetical protein